MSKSKEKRGGGVFGVLQRVGRSFMLPIALLPIAGLLLGIGSSFTNPAMIEAYNLEKLLGEGTVLNFILTVMSETGNIIFGNLPILFAMGVALGMAENEKATATLSAAIAFFVMHQTISTLLRLTGGFEGDVLEGTIATVVGIKSLEMGVFGGIIVGLGVAWLHNRFYKIRLPSVISFFGGVRFVPIISTLAYILVGVGMFFLWPIIQKAIFRPGERLCGHLHLRCHRACADPLRFAPRLLSPLLADGTWRLRYDRRRAGLGCAEHLLCRAGISLHPGVQRIGDPLYER